MQEEGPLLYMYGLWKENARWTINGNQVQSVMLESSIVSAWHQTAKCLNALRRFVISVRRMWTVS